jgi:hypothetical protein
MSDSTPDRLKAFRAESAEREGRGASGRIGLNLLALASAALIGAGLGMFYSEHKGASASDAKRLREQAALLAEKDLPDQAIAAYQEYLNTADLDEGARAKTCYAVANIAIDAADYEQALAYLYQAEQLAPKSEIAPEVSKKIVLCLDQLGRSSDSQRHLKKQTDLRRSASEIEAGEVVLAEFDGQVLTDRDLDRAIAKLPAAAQGNLDAPEHRVDLLRNLVVERLLLERAFERGLDDDAEIQARLLSERDSLMVRKLIADEVAGKLTLTEEEYKAYYEQEIKRFTRPASAQVQIARGESEAAAAALTEFPAKRYVVEQGRPIPGISVEQQAVDAIVSTAVGERTIPYLAGEYWYVFNVLGTRPGQVLPFDKVRGQVSRLATQQKQREQMEALVAKTLQEGHAILHTERITGEGAP